jgi:uncharacterized protein (DUF1015 family)
MRFSLHGQARRIRGLVCALELEDWGGSIVPHEHTMSGPVGDRLQLMRSLPANLSSIHAVLTAPCPELEGFLERSTQGEPEAELSDEQGVQHRLWVATDGGRLVQELGQRTMMIADGHHRYTTALLFRDEMRARRGPGPWDQVMTLVVDAASEDLPVLPYHRVLPQGRVPTAGTPVRDLLEVLEAVDDDRPTYGIAVREGGGLIHRVAALTGDPPAVCALHEEILGPEEEGLWFTPDAIEAEDAVRAGHAAAAFFLPPTTASRIRMVVDRGHRLPRKSTYFWPKPRTGLVLRPLEIIPPAPPPAS